MLLSVDKILVSADFGDGYLSFFGCIFSPFCKAHWCSFSLAESWWKKILSLFTTSTIDFLIGWHYLDSCHWLLNWVAPPRSLPLLHWFLNWVAVFRSLSLAFKLGGSTLIFFIAIFKTVALHNIVNVTFLAFELCMGATVTITVISHFKIKQMTPLLLQKCSTWHHHPRHHLVAFVISVILGIGHFHRHWPFSIKIWELANLPWPLKCWQSGNYRCMRWTQWSAWTGGCWMLLSNNWKCSWTINAWNGHCIVQGGQQ